jgi:glyceraldehyde-3-phosphate dehydrogenase/erythrose-4-phosphate dehydrogenase
MTRSERLAAIKEAADRFNAKIKKNVRFHDYTETAKSERSSDDNQNINAWTDSEKYVDEYYGDRARAVSAYDNEWN